MDNLRLILFITGCLLVLGLYIWEFRKGAKKSSDILEAVDEIPEPSAIPDITVPSSSAEKHPDYSAVAKLGNLLARSRSPVVEDTATHKIVTGNDALSEQVDKALPLQMRVNDHPGGLTDPDAAAEIEEQVNEDEAATAAPDIAEEHQEKEQPPAHAQDREDLLVLHISSPQHETFNGLSVNKAADAAGMIFGRMNIFHHFGTGGSHSGQALFSMANMFEPGSFDPDRLAELETQGIVIFMYLPVSADAGVVFELFIDTARRISRLLGGELKTANNESLNADTIKALREKAESLSVK